ncbi:uncharacterized protein BKA78DRAFT_54798 [Phyllosticta capitalensis]|uniref:uncharacterized protein n=1 Tax=Phyllosticta capitalensis TaxID=121624 RepID=UPI00312E98DC
MAGKQHRANAPIDLPTVPSPSLPARAGRLVLRFRPRCRSEPRHRAHRLSFNTGDSDGNSQKAKALERSKTNALAFAMTNCSPNRSRGVLANHLEVLGLPAPFTRPKPTPKYRERASESCGGDWVRKERKRSKRQVTCQRKLWKLAPKIRSERCETVYSSRTERDAAR